MVNRLLILGLVFAGMASAMADPMLALVDQAMTGLVVRASDAPYSRTIEKMFIGYDAQGEPKVGIAYRTIESFQPITAVVVIHKTPDGFVLHEALFPDSDNIRDAKERKQVASILEQFRNVPFDPHAEKSAVDGLTGATRHGIKTSGFLNYMARRTAIEMESKPNWPVAN